MKIPANIAEAVALQPDYLGFIFYPESKRFVADLDAAVVRDIPASIKTTGVFVNAELEEVKKAVAAYHFKAVQLHGNESPPYCMALKGTLEVIKAFGIDEAFDFNLLENYAAAVDYFLFDTQTPAHGGSGKTFSWRLLENYALQIPYFLSGGIGLEHAADLLLITDERFYAIDVNSRFEIQPGIKDIAQLTQFKKSLRC